METLKVPPTGNNGCSSFPSQVLGAWVLAAPVDEVIDQDCYIRPVRTLIFVQIFACVHYGTMFGFGNKREEEKKRCFLKSEQKVNVGVHQSSKQCYRT